MLLHLFVWLLGAENNLMVHKQINQSCYHISEDVSVRIKSLKKQLRSPSLSLTKKTQKYNQLQVKL